MTPRGEPGPAGISGSFRLTFPGFALDASFELPARGASVLFGTLTGALSDRFGRKRLCISFCIIYSISCLLSTVFSNFWCLIIGRILGRIYF